MKSIAILLAAVSAVSAAAPAPKDIPAILEQADSVEIIETDFSKGGKIVRRSEITPQAAAELGAMLADAEPTEGCCMCAGNPVIEIRKNGAPTKTITIHHGLTVRMRGGKLNAKIASPRRLADWLADRGFSSTKNELEREEKSAGKSSASRTVREK